MYNREYHRGVSDALENLGIKHASRSLPMKKEDEQGSPYPEKNMNIPAEQLARALRSIDEYDDKASIAPENRGRDTDGTVSWQAPITLNNAGPVAGSVSMPGSR